jgi:hypothetical protein
LAASVSFSSGNSISENLNDGETSCAMSIDGYAGGGAVGVKGTLSQTPGKSSIHQIRANVSSSMTSIAITPEAGRDAKGLFETYGSAIPVTVNAAIEGSLSASVATNSPFVRGAQAVLRANLNFSGFSEPGNPVSKRVDFFKSEGATNSGADTVGDVFAQSLTATLLLDWSIPFVVEFSMGGSAGTSGYGDSFATAVFDSLNSLSFSKTGPAFILPDGFTVNAPELNIINNRWSDPRLISPVPLPASLPILAVALGILGIIQRKRIGSFSLT